MKLSYFIFNILRNNLKCKNCENKINSFRRENFCICNSEKLQIINEIKNILQFPLFTISKIIKIIFLPQRFCNEKITNQIILLDSNEPSFINANFALKKIINNTTTLYIFDIFNTLSFWQKTKVLFLSFKNINLIENDIKLYYNIYMKIYLSFFKKFEIMLIYFSFKYFIKNNSFKNYNFYMFCDNSWSIRSIKKLLDDININYKFTLVQKSIHTTPTDMIPTISDEIWVWSEDAKQIFPKKYRKKINIVGNIYINKIDLTYLENINKIDFENVVYWTQHKEEDISVCKFLINFCNKFNKQLYIKFHPMDIKSRYDGLKYKELRDYNITKEVNIILSSTVIIDMLKNNKYFFVVDTQYDILKFKKYDLEFLLIKLDDSDFLNKTLNFTFNKDKFKIYLKKYWGFFL